MDQTARLAVFEQKVKFSPAFKQVLQTVLEVVDKALAAPVTAEGRLVPVSSVPELGIMLQVNGTSEYLGHIGFHLQNKILRFPPTNDVKNLKLSKKALERKLQILNAESGVKHGARRKTCNVQPSGRSVLDSSNEFLKSVESTFKQVLKYEDKELQAKARECIPLATLQTRAMKRIREQQKAIKKGLEETEGPFEMVLLTELVSWFKNSFFTWVDRPACRVCGSQTSFMKNTVTKVEGETCRVEVFRCPMTECLARTEFVRHNDPAQLLRTRAGRCGEWANCFTLMLRTIGLDARYVVDTTDHVWCEVYDAFSRSWTHVDPCEGAVNTPLMYEHGWGKKLEYVIAYSRDDIQDVTWRYSSRHAEVYPRRVRCTETELITALLRLREERRTLLRLSAVRINFLQQRLIAELADLMVEKQPGYYDRKGRISGSKEWREQRGELGARRKHVWRFDTVGEHTVDYYPVRDEYLRRGEGRAETLDLQWMDGTWDYENVRRNVENDWKMVYLARIDGAVPGHVSWRLEAAEGMLMESTSICQVSQSFDSGVVEWSMSVDDAQFEPLIFECVDGLTTADVLRSCRSLVVTATLRGGAGDVGWQHAQLFRLPLDSTAEALNIVVNIVKNN